jgi:hypothetical protein
VEVEMSAHVHEWPAEYQGFLAGLSSNPRHPGCYSVEVDVTSDDLKVLGLFEVASRIGRVRFREASSPAPLVGFMNPLVGIGHPAEGGTYAARVRISFHDVVPE